MNSLFLILRLLTSTLLLILALSTFSKYRQSKEKIYIELGLTLLSTAGWALSALIFTLTKLDIAELILVRLSFSFGYLSSICLFRFMHLKYSHTIKSKIMKKVFHRGFKLSGIISIFLVLLSLTKYVATSVSAQNVVAKYGVLYWPANLMALSFSAIATTILFLPKNLNAENRLQHKYLKVIVPINVGLVFFSNVILPNIIQTSKYSPFGVLSLAIFGIGLWAVIRKHRFLDLRYVLNRTISFFIYLTIIISSFLIVNTISRKFFGEALAESALILGAALTVLYTYLFKKIITKIYQIVDKRLVKLDYDPLKVLEQFSTITSTTLETGRLIEESEKLIEKMLGISDCSIKLIDIQRQKVDYETVVQIRSRGVLLGHLICQEKITEAPYSINDLNLLNKIANQLAVALERAKLHQKVKDFNKDLQEKIKKATKELEENVKELRLARRREQEILDIMGHELRSPATVAKGAIDYLLTEQPFKESSEVKKYLMLARSGINRQFSLSKRFLTAAKLSKGIFTIDPSPTDFSVLLEKTIEGLKPAARQKGLTLELAKPKKPVFIDADPQAMQQVFDNLLDNAIKYTKQGSIKVKIEKKQNNVEITIKDTGIGIPQKELSKIGKKFYRVKRKEDLQITGTGIGLYVASEIIKAHKGKLEIKSQEGKGTTVKIILGSILISDPIYRTRTQTTQFFNLPF